MLFPATAPTTAPTAAPTAAPTGPVMPPAAAPAAAPPAMPPATPPTTAPTPLLASGRPSLSLVRSRFSFMESPWVDARHCRVAAGPFAHWLVTETHTVKRTRSALGFCLPRHAVGNRLPSLVGAGYEVDDHARDSRRSGR